ncbi:MAG: TRAP transporter substrate-binding protein [Pirellulaceae bacterium]
MRRRDVLSRGVLALGAGLATPALSQNRQRLRMVTDWPNGPGLFSSASRLAKRIGEATDGRLSIEVFASGELVRAFETLAAVEAGVVDMYQSHDGYFQSRAPAFHFFSGVPFGLTANELFAWVRYGGGQQLWDELSGRFNIKPLCAASTGSQMGGWFRREIQTSDDFRGLRYRTAEPGAEVLRRLGAIVVLLPGSDVLLAMQSGAIDACELIGPWMDVSMGISSVASVYHYPAWQEPGTVLTLGVNRQVWDGLSESDRQLIQAVAEGEFAVSLAEFNTNNALSLRRLREEGSVRVARFPDSVLNTLRDVSVDVVAELGSGDDLARRIYASFTNFREVIAEWTAVSEGAYIGTRGTS